MPNCRSRDALGKQIEGSLFDYFNNKYPHPSQFNKAQNNFIKSMAGYSLVSFLINIKDRHNGNILVDDEGHIIHIDFGFIFDLSPGGDFKFERAPFKLTEEMIQLLGGNPNAQAYQTFVDLMIRGFKFFLF